MTDPFPLNHYFLIQKKIICGNFGLKLVMCERRFKSVRYLCIVDIFNLLKTEYFD